MDVGNIKKVAMMKISSGRYCCITGKSEIVVVTQNRAETVSLTSRLRHLPLN